MSRTAQHIPSGAAHATAPNPRTERETATREPPNAIARAARWSAAHRKAAMLGWLSANLFGTTYRLSNHVQPGGRPGMPPDRRSFWAARVAGRGNQTLTWSVKPGRWAVVVMRPDGSRGVSAELAAGARLPALLWASIGFGVLGLLILGGAVAPIYFGANQPAPTPPEGYPQDPTTRDRRIQTPQLPPSSAV